MSLVLNMNISDNKLLIIWDHYKYLGVAESDYLNGLWDERQVAMCGNP